MTLDAQTRALLDQAKEAGAPPLYEMAVQDARVALKTMTQGVQAPGAEVGSVEDRLIPGPDADIPVRIYWPAVARSAMKDAPERLPVLLQFHGGGFALGDLDTHDSTARHYCARAQVIVVSVDYRRSPEHRFPAAVEDCYAALCWVHEHAAALGADPERLAVTGDSAGGNLSAVICQLARSRQGPPIAFQVLVYPVMSLDLNALYPSRTEMGGGEYFLGMQDMVWFNGMYLRSEKDVQDNRASPILMEDLSGLPPALILTAGYDPLRDEGRHYAERLEEAGVAVAYRCFGGTIHGFISFSGALDAGREALDMISDRLHQTLC